MPQELWPEGQRGREITVSEMYQMICGDTVVAQVYIYMHDSKYGAALAGLPYTAQEIDRMRLGREFEMSSDQLWSFVKSTEDALALHGVLIVKCRLSTTTVFPLELPSCTVESLNGCCVFDL